MIVLPICNFGRNSADIYTLQLHWAPEPEPELRRRDRTFQIRREPGGRGLGSK